MFHLTVTRLCCEMRRFSAKDSRLNSIGRQMRDEIRKEIKKEALRIYRELGGDSYELRSLERHEDEEKEERDNA
jgi:hypothetical protein